MWLRAATAPCAITPRPLPATHCRKDAPECHAIRTPPLLATIRLSGLPGGACGEKSENRHKSYHGYQEAHVGKRAKTDIVYDSHPPEGATLFPEHGRSLRWVPPAPLVRVVQSSCPPLFRLSRLFRIFLLLTPGDGAKRLPLPFVIRTCKGIGCHALHFRVGSDSAVSILRIWQVRLQQQRPVTRP
ncbi:hypothetical protein NDU88_004899 [Pleurodeles waltl]|uniref:Uncharacterized protein n=1 Tax=Pleurodeles waltl TaxID=8319 RepID=A0AAV7TB11_PLEWA|nr:hypothetical protein NDU88_004899 [Pleurodeles waltl]